jgi:hypothetical protein
MNVLLKFTKYEHFLELNFLNLNIFFTYEQFLDLNVLSKFSKYEPFFEHF